LVRPHEGHGRERHGALRTPEQACGGGVRLLDALVQCSMRIGSP
jgi:hypothetical protein